MGVTISIYFLFYKHGEKEIEQGIIILGPSGSRKITLGKIVAQQLKILFLDIDDYIWHKDTEIPFSTMYSRTEKINRLMETISKTDHFIMVGSMDSFHKYFDPFLYLQYIIYPPPRSAYYKSIITGT